MSYCGQINIKIRKSKLNILSLRFCKVNIDYILQRGTFEDPFRASNCHYIPLLFALYWRPCHIVQSHFIYSDAIHRIRVPTRLLINNSSSVLLEQLLLCFIYLLDWHPFLLSKIISSHNLSFLTFWFLRLKHIKLSFYMFLLDQLSFGLLFDFFWWRLVSASRIYNLLFLHNLCVNFIIQFRLK